MTFWQGGLIIICVALAACSAYGQSIVTWENDKVFVDGEPFFYYGFIWQEDGSIEDYAKHHFNAFYARTDLAKIAAAQKAGLKVMAGVTGDEELMAELAQAPNLVAWFILDDASGTEALKKCRERVAIVKRVDTNHPTIADENSRTVEGDKPFADLLDIYAPYTYPIPRQTMEEYEHDFLDKLRDGCGRKYIWGAFQCSGIYSFHFRMGFQPDHLNMYMEPAQFRLLVWMAISHGMRGIMLWPDTGLFMPKDKGGDRLAEASIVGCELELLGPFIVAGDERRDAARTSHEDVEVCQIDRGEESLLILTKHGENYHYAVDEALATDVQVRFRPAGDLEGYHAYSVSFPEVSELSVRALGQHLSIEVGSVQVTDLILVTKDRTHIERLSAGMAQRLADVARSAQELLDCFSAKAGWVHRSLQALNVDLRDGVSAPGIWEQAEAAKATAQQLYQEGELAASYRAARGAEALYRKLLYLYRERADDYIDMVPAEARIYRMMPYSLPDYFSSFDPKAAPMGEGQTH